MSENKIEILIDKIEYVSARARLGNAVMPKFMQAIATTIKTELLGYPHA